jgi:hypothetical protein
VRTEIVRIKIVIATGLALIAIAVFVTLLHSPATVAATNGVQPSALLAAATEATGACQGGETLPARTSAIRLQLEATTGPRVSVEVLQGRRVLTRGTEGTAWYGSVVTIPVKPLAHALTDATVCFQLSALSGEVALYGTQTRPAIAATGGGKSLSGRLRIVYLTPGSQSWWSLAGAVIRHMALGRAASGTWIVLAIMALGMASIGVGSWILARELR